jgi:hypothetical protein
VSRWAPAISPGDESSNDEDGGGEAECGVSVSCSSVGVAAQLAVVRPPRVSCFDDPAQTETQGLLLHAGHVGAAPRDLELIDADTVQPAPHRAGVVAAIEVQGADVAEQPAGTDRVEGGFEHADIAAVRAVDRPTDRDAVALRGDRPLPAQLLSISGVRAGSFTAIGRLVQRSIERDIVKVEADDPVERR